MQPGMRGYVYGSPIDWGSPIQVASDAYAGNSGARCTRVNDEYWIFWKNSYSNDTYYVQGSGDTWSSPWNIGYPCSAVPGVAVFANQIYAAYSHPDDNALMWTSYDLSWGTPPQVYTKWSDPVQVPGAWTDSPPALAVYDEKLYLAWSTPGNAPTLSYCWFDGKNWSTPRNTGHPITGGPAMAAHDGELFFACARGSNSPIVYIRYSNGTLAAPEITNGSYISEYGPALASNGEELWMTWYGYPNLQALASTWTRDSGWSAAGYFANAFVDYSPGMYGDFSGLRLVWLGSYPSGLWTLSKTVNGCKNYWIRGAAMPDSWVTVSVTENLTTQTYLSVQANGNGDWSMSLDADLNDGDRIQATASFEINGPQSDAFVRVIGQSQANNYLNIKSVTPTGVSGNAPESGQIIKGWRSSDGALVVNYTANSANFVAPYLFPGAYRDGDTINLVSQFPHDGSMTQFSGGPRPYFFH